MWRIGVKGSKQALRDEVLAARRTLPVASRRHADQAITAAAAVLARSAAIISAYAPMPGEPGGSDLPDALAAVCGTVLLPVVLPDLDLDWAAHRGPGRSAVPASAQAAGHPTAPERGCCPPASPISATGRGPREPDGPRLGPSAVARAEIVFVPALAVDRSGVRLGRGGGSFDRALARVHPGTPVVALLYQGELRDRLPAEAHDRPVTAVITPTGLTLLGPTGVAGAATA